MGKNKKLLFIVNVDWFFVSHRLPIAVEAIKRGYEVHIATTITDKNTILEKNGLIVHNLSMHRSRANISTLFELWNIMSVIRFVTPDVVNLVTIKPVLLGGIAAKLLKVPAVVSSISGLGYVFHSDGLISFIRRKLVLLFYYFALAHKNQKIIVQNAEDRLTLCKIRNDIYDKSILIPGSGIDLSLYSTTKNTLNPVTVLMASRLLSSKGVREFVQASRIIRRGNQSVRFVLAGGIDSSNPESITQSELNRWKSEGVVEILGYRNDMYNVISQASIVVLPSYYGEGLPKVLIEAAACGRVVITTDHPGCRDAVTTKTGILIPIKDSQALADAIQYLLLNPQKMLKMGQAGRLLAEQRYSIKKVCKTHIEIYQDLLMRAK